MRLQPTRPSPVGGEEGLVMGDAWCHLLERAHVPGRLRDGDMPWALEKPITYLAEGSSCSELRA